MRPLAVVRGAGDLATAVGRRLHLCGFSVVHFEIPRPLAIRRAVAFASAVFEGCVTVEGVTARLARDVAEARAILGKGDIAVLIDPGATSLSALEPAVLVDAIMAKRNLGTRRDMAPCVVALGPGFTAGLDAHAVVETSRGKDLGCVYTSGTALPDTGIPGTIAGVGAMRVLRAAGSGTFRPAKAIGDVVRAGEVVAHSGDAEVRTPIAGVLRGILHPGSLAHEGQKVGDVDPRGDRELCFRISDKASAVAEGVIEAVLRAREERGDPEGPVLVARGSRE